MSVSKRVKIQGVWKFKTAVEVDGRIVQHMVLVDGNVQRHPEGHYYYRLNEGKWVKLDACPESNKKARERVQVHPLPIEHGLISPLETGRTNSVRDAIEPYLTSYTPGRMKKTVEGMRRTLNPAPAIASSRCLNPP
jgi:hypothetical protein